MHGVPSCSLTFPRIPPVPFGEDALGTEATCDSVAERKLGVKAWIVRVSFRGTNRGARSGPASQRQAERTIILSIVLQVVRTGFISCLPASQDSKRLPGGVEGSQPSRPQALRYQVFSSTWSSTALVPTDLSCCGDHRPGGIRASA